MTTRKPEPRWYDDMQTLDEEYGPDSDFGPDGKIRKAK